MFWIILVWISECHFLELTSLKEEESMENNLLRQMVILELGLGEKRSHELN